MKRYNKIPTLRNAFFGLIMFVIAIFGCNYLHGVQSNQEINLTDSYITVLPFEIDGDWSSISSNSWCQGSGSSSNPYVISGISITTSHTESKCIGIKNSNAYFKIRNCEFTLSPGLGYAGMIIENCQNGVIEDCIFTNNYDEENIEVRESQFISIRSNILTHALTGIRLYESSSITVEDNYIADSFLGIKLVYCLNCLITNNEIRIIDRINSISYDLSTGINLYYSNDNTITNNNFYCIPNPIEFEGDNAGNIISNNQTHECLLYRAEDMFLAEMIIASVVIFIQLFSSPNFAKYEKKIRRILFGIGIGVIGLLIHALVNLAMTSVGLMVLQYGIWLVALFAGQITILLKSYNNLKKDI